MSTLQEFLQTTVHLLETCEVQIKGGKAYLATPPEGLAPWIVTHEQATALLAFTELNEIERARYLIRALLALQHPKGHWAAAYRPDGKPLGGPGIASSAAVAWALLKYAQHEENPAVAKGLAPHMHKVLRMFMEQLHPQLELPFVQGDVLPPAYSAGFSLWTASLMVAVFRLAGELYRERDYTDMAGFIRAAINLHLVQDGRFIIRLTPQGMPDPRPTIALLAPALFEVEEVHDDLVTKTRQWIERTLVDRRIGGLRPFLAYAPGEGGVLPGVWPTATAWFARYLYLAGERESGDKLLRRLLNSVVDGAMPQTILTSDLLPFVRAQKQALVNGAGRAVEQGVVRRLLDDLAQQAKERSFLYAICPAFASHMETVRAFVAGGYIRTLNLPSLTSG